MFKKLLRILVLGIALIGVYQYLNKPHQGREPPRPHREASASRPAPSAESAPTGATSSPNPNLQFSSQHPKDFDEAKSILKRLYAQGTEIYCGCPYDLERKDRIDAAACGYKGHGARSKRIEWEHVVPASIFGQKFSEWTQGNASCQRKGHMEKGRNCARATNPTFARMEADLYNLLPSLGELNAARSNYPFGEIGGEPRAWGRCDFEVENRVVEPPTQVRGDVARIYFYMEARYPGFEIVNRKNEGMLAAWDRDDPMDEAERNRLKRIEEIQGNSFFIGRLSRLAIK